MIQTLKLSSLKSDSRGKKINSFTFSPVVAAEIKPAQLSYFFFHPLLAADQQGMKSSPRIDL